MTAQPVRRFPRQPIREHSKSGHLRHSLRQGWRTSYPEEFPVEIRSIDFNGHCPIEPALPGAGLPDAYPVLPVAADWPQLPSGSYDADLAGAA